MDNIRQCSKKIVVETRWGEP